jgi:hypothetical protein
VSISAVSWVLRGGPTGGPVRVDLEACRARRIGEHKVWHVLFVLAEAANSKTSQVWLDRATTCELARMHRRDVDKCIAVLIDSRLLQRARPAGGPGRPPVYQLLMPGVEGTVHPPPLAPAERAGDAPSIERPHAEQRAEQRAGDARREPDPDPDPDPDPAAAAAAAATHSLVARRREPDAANDGDLVSVAESIRSVLPAHWNGDCAAHADEDQR